MFEDEEIRETLEAIEDRYDDEAEDTPFDPGLAPALAEAAAPYMLPKEAAELAANVACSLAFGSPISESEIESMIRHRMEHWSTVCGDVISCAAAIARAARRRKGQHLIAAGKTGPAWGLKPGQWIAATGRA